MPVNEFLPFGLGAGANVATQAAWANEVSRSTGFQAGTAKSSLGNKAWRQSSFMAHVLAQMIMESANADVLDNGDVATLKARMMAAIKAVAGTQGVSDELAAYKKIVDGLFASTNGNIGRVDNSLAAAISRIATLEAHQSGQMIKYSVYANPGGFTHVFAEETNMFMYELIGGGGSGAGGPAPAAGQCTVGGGGGSGGFTAGVAYQRRTRVGASIGITVGRGGIGVAGTGEHGTTTSLGTMAYAYGGRAGAILGPAAVGCGNAGAGALPGSVFNEPGFSNPVFTNAGDAGSPGIILNSTNALGGKGGVGPYGGGGNPAGPGSAGQSAQATGGGGGGCCLLAAQGPVAGGNGANGLIRIWEYT